MVNALGIMSIVLVCIAEACLQRLMLLKAVIICGISLICFMAYVWLYLGEEYEKEHNN